MIRHLLLMTGLASCTDDCSGRGECHNGTCLCEVRFAGEHCDGPNVAYHAGIGGVFLLVALVCAIQLMMCIVSEYQRLKAPTFLRACRVTTQKLLYFVAFLASALRGAYFLSPNNFRQSWSSSLLSAYYPLLMSASSLIVCFWAEVFHLRDIRWERSQFLSKSFLGFVTFNILSYGLLFAEIVTTQLAEPPPHDRSFYTHLFNGCYAVLLFIVVIFFLIYGVEVFFKVRGGFITRPVHLAGHHLSVNRARTFSRNLSGAEDQSETERLSRGDLSRGDLSRADISKADLSKSGLSRTEGLLRAERLSRGESGTLSENLALSVEADVLTEDDFRPQINNSQLHQSRIGLLSQALMLITIVGFLFSETLSEFWKTKVPVYSRNWHDIVFRTFEIGVAIWFPCVLWNCMQPSELWILNPRKLLAKLDQKTNEYIPTSVEGDTNTAESDAFIDKRECWICYDTERPDPLIQPCACTGDVSSVHHECLRRWLMESSSSSTESLRCKVCNNAYDVTTTSRLDWEKGFTAHHWGSTVVTVTVMCVSVAVAWIVIQMFESPYIRMASASLSLLVVYICIKFLGQNTVSAYQRAKVGGINIGNHTISAGVPEEAVSSQPHTAL